MTPSPSPSAAPRETPAYRSGAIFSDCRRYRYALWREWDRQAPQFVVIGLNPSTADETEDDPTIRRCIAFAKREGCGKLVMLNLFAVRATQPSAMKSAFDPIGPDTNRLLVNYAEDPRTRHVVAAWGVHGAFGKRDQRVLALQLGALSCFGVTKDGHPKHPLYLRADTPLIPFTRKASHD